MNICGCLVHALPERASEVSTRLAATDGVEVHAQGDDGRIVIVVEDTARQPASATIMDLHQMPGVVSITLTYHHFEESDVPPASAGPDRMTAAGGQTHDHL